MAIATVDVSCVQTKREDHKTECLGTASRKNPSRTILIEMLKRKDKLKVLACSVQTKKRRRIKYRTEKER